MRNINEILEKINQAKPLDFGIIFSDSIELFKKTWVQGFLLQVFTIIIMMPLIVVIYLPIIGILLAQTKNGYSDPTPFADFFAGMSIISILFIIAAVFALSTISFVLNAGFFRIMKKLDFNEEVFSSDFFYFFKSHYFNKTFILVLATVGIAIVALLLCYVPIFYALVPLSFINMVFAFNPDLSAGDIVKASFKLGNKKWLLAFGLIIISSILAQIVGMIMCFVGVLFTAAFVYHPTYLIYKEIIGFEEENPFEVIE
ncbi:hypothetical protein V8G56_08465 [Gaetbulibacter aquiaggeris]|uniref:Glycerophosphoryl diester phosphodiesterase membrane domain-containing protein n=1 Tax=Gaetbulibacter aquiaggeris TaxID=1735373 RepID=A0ABW7MPM2_9FLAO